MILWTLPVYTLVAVIAISAEASPVDILGIPRSADPLYAAAKAKGKFTCQSDKKIVIPFVQVGYEGYGRLTMCACFLLKI